MDGPILIAQPAAVVSNTILFPLGLTKIKSPAASFLPGHLIAEAWGPGHLVAIGLVLLAGLGVAASLILRPPRDERAAGWRLVTGLVLMFAFAPASRFGYAVYPLGLACWLLLAGPADGPTVPAGGHPAASQRGRTEHTMIVAFSITPLGVGEGVGEYVADAVRVVRDSGLPNRTDAMFTSVEGDWDEVMDVVRRAVDAVAARAPRVSLVLKADIRPGVTDGLDSKVATIERHLQD